MLQHRKFVARSTSRTAYSVVFVTIASLLLGACADDPTKLSDGKAVEVLQDAWKDETRLFDLGPLAFRSGNSTGRGYTMMSRYPLYRAFANAGLIGLEREQDLTQGFSGWNNFLAQTQSGVQRVATVTLSELGGKLGTVHQVQGSENSFVTFVVGNYKIEKIVSNDPIELNGEKYRVILGTHVFDVKSEFRPALQEAGEPLYRERRFRALLKYDPFKSQWALQTADIAPRDVDFPTTYVPSMLARLRVAGAS